METNRARLTARLITVAWVIGSRPCTPNRAVGLSHARPHGPLRNRAAGRGSHGTIEGASSVADEQLMMAESTAPKNRTCAKTGMCCRTKVGSTSCESFSISSENCLGSISVAA